MRKFFVFIVGLTAISDSYIGYQNVTVQVITELQLNNIEALANEESPVKIPCAYEKDSECKFLTEGSDGIWRHIVIEDMKKTSYHESR